MLKIKKRQKVCRPPNTVSYKLNCTKNDSQRQGKPLGGQKEDGVTAAKSRLLNSVLGFIFRSVIRPVYSGNRAVAGCSHEASNCSSPCDPLRIINPRRSWPRQLESQVCRWDCGRWNGAGGRCGSARRGADGLPLLSA